MSEAVTTRRENGQKSERVKVALGINSGAVHFKFKCCRWAAASKGKGGEAPSRKVGKNEDAFTLLQRGGGGNKIALFGTRRMTCLEADKLATARRASVTGLSQRCKSFIFSHINCRNYPKRCNERDEESAAQAWCADNAHAIIQQTIW